MSSLESSSFLTEEEAVAFLLKATQNDSHLDAIDNAKAAAAMAPAFRELEEEYFSQTGKPVIISKYDTEGNGNCLVNAVADHLERENPGGSTPGPALLRTKAVEILKEDKNGQFSKDFDEREVTFNGRTYIEKYDDYVKRMAQNNEFFEKDGIKALAIVLRRPIKVMSVFPANREYAHNLTVHKPHSASGEKGAITLLHTAKIRGPAHFNLLGLIPVHDPVGEVKEATPEPELVAVNTEEPVGEVKEATPEPEPAAVSTEEPVVGSTDPVSY